MNEQKNIEGVVVKYTLPRSTVYIRESFSFYLRYLKNFLLVMCVPFIFSVVTGLLLFYTDIGSISKWVYQLAALLDTAVGLVASSVLFILVVEGGELKEGLAEIYHRGLHFAIPLLWISVLLSLAIVGGAILFVIPGIVLFFLLILSGYTLFAEGKRGMSALIGSMHYVKGYVWAVIRKVAVLSLVLFILGAIIFMLFILAADTSRVISGMIGDRSSEKMLLAVVRDAYAYFFGMPVGTIYVFMIYQTLLRIKGEVIEPEEERKISRWLKIFIGIGVVFVLFLLGNAVLRVWSDTTHAI